jgi:hypothetical protein
MSLVSALAMAVACGGKTSAAQQIDETASGGHDAGVGPGRMPAGAGGGAGSRTHEGGTRGEGGSASLVPSVDLTPAGFPRCGALEPARANDCKGIDKIALTGPDVSSIVDGSIQVGELMDASVWVRNQDDLEHDDVCVGVVVDVPEIRPFTEPAAANPVRVGRLPAVDAAFIIDVARLLVGEVTPGTVATFTFWSTYVGTNCAGPTVSVRAPVRPWR